MTTRVATTCLATASALLVGVAGCATGNDVIGDEDQDILGGFPARSEKFNAIGMLLGVRPTGPAPICTGTLIGPHTVLAAGHCVRPVPTFKIIDRFPVYFRIGYDSANPVQEIRAIYGGTTTVAGHDVGIYQLERDVEGVVPIAVSDVPLTEENLGDKVSIVGYGLQGPDNNFFQFLTRRAAKFSVTTFRPQALQDLFADATALEAFMEEFNAKDFTPEQVALLWNHPILRGPFDVFVGAPWEPQISFLDSGAPALTNVDDVLTIHGVNARSYDADPWKPNTGIASDLLPVGSVIAMTGVDGTREMIDTALTDPCRNVTSAGHCSATLAIRCPEELPDPTISTFDCAEFDATCVIDAEGVAGCE